jgi:hypothetical protein
LLLIKDMKLTLISVMPVGSVRWSVEPAFVFPELFEDLSNHDRRRSENGDLPTSMLRSTCVTPILNPLSRREGPSLRSLGSQSLASPRLASLALTRSSPHCYAWFRDGYSRGEATGSEGSFLKGLSVWENHRASRSPVR